MTNLREALRQLSVHGSVTSQSHIYETEAWGNEDQPNFYNMAVAYKTKLTALDLLALVNDIEDKMGRLRNEKWSPRIIDIDILTYDDQVIDEPNLTIPHKHMSNRNFVLIPLMEVAEEWTHPVSQKSIDDIYLECHDPCEVIMIDNKL